MPFVLAQLWAVGGHHLPVKVPGVWAKSSSQYRIGFGGGGGTGKQYQVSGMPRWATEDHDGLHEKGGWFWWEGPLMASTCCSYTSSSDVILASVVARAREIVSGRWAQAKEEKRTRTYSAEGIRALGLKVATRADGVAGIVLLRGFTPK